MRKRLSETTKIQRERRQHKWWKRVVTVLACAVVFCTTYALILPAITMEGLTCGQEEHVHTDVCYNGEELVCGQEEHTHTDTCYQKESGADPQADVEEAADWEKTFQELVRTGDVRIDAAAIAKSQLGYTESTKNYIIDEDGQIRNYSRYGQWYGDCYGDWSGMFVAFCLHYAGADRTPAQADCGSFALQVMQEQPEYWYEAGEYTPVPGDVIFLAKETLRADHAGIVTQVVTDANGVPVSVCAAEGDVDGAVQETAYDLTDPGIMGYAVPAGTGEEPETASETEKESTAESSEAGSAQTEKETETGTEGTSGAVEKENGTLELTYAGPDYTICVRYGEEAEIPEGTVLTAEELVPGSEIYQTYYEQAAAAAGTGETVLFARFFDLEFRLNGEKLEPAAPVSVTITYAQEVPAEGDVNCQAVHFAEEGPEVLPVETQTEEGGGTSFTHTQEGFSVVGDLITASAVSAVDNGPDVFPVDYYVYLDGAWTCVGSTKTGWYGDYTANGWTNNNRDCITVAQAESVLGMYGFNASTKDAALQIAYQRKETDIEGHLHCDTVSYSDETKSSSLLIPLARNVEKTSGYNVYFLPGNTNNSLSVTYENVNVEGNQVYTVSVYDPNGLVYTDATLPAKQYVITGGHVSVMVEQIAEDRNAAWQCVNRAWEQAAEEVDNGDVTVTFSVSNVTQTLRITPVSERLGTAHSRTVHYLVYLDGVWTEVGTTATIYQNNAVMERCFVTSAQVESVLGKYGFRSAEYSYESGKGNSLVHQFADGTLDGAFWSDNESEKLADGSWAIGLSYDVKDYNLYWLPVNATSFADKTPNGYAADSGAMSGNHIWSVTVRDNGNFVYSDGDLESMVQYAPDGGKITVRVRNADGVLWSCVGKNGLPVEAEAAQSGGYTTFTISNLSQPEEVAATKANPEFTVQYYANIPRYAASGDNPLKVIDTSAAANNGSATLPKNGQAIATKSLYLEATGQNTTQNRGQQTALYRIKMVNELTKLYSDKDYQYLSAPDLQYFNKMRDSENYTLKEIWVLNPGKNAASTNRADWTIYSAGAETGFTNEAGQADANTILIEENAVIRLVSDTSSGEYHNDTTFYDYNISSGRNEGNGNWLTGITGINREGNYGKSANGERTWRSGADILAFGNANCGTGMSGYLFDGSTLNKYSSKNSAYDGATFGLVSGLNQDGTICYNEWIVAPKLFNEAVADKDVYGKQTYAGSSLLFDRVGDTYTLNAATLNNYSGSNTISNLQYFFNPSPTAGTVHSHIFTNNFWPMDLANNPDRVDENWGEYGNTGLFNGFVETNDYKWTSADNKSFPSGDDGNAHNWFFGMNFSLSFRLTEDYEGPLEYYFFGDDDLWVFLDGKLVCDIGGVHSSIGEYVNLRDYLPVGAASSGKHTLSFFYTERGASGSTCYMSFTLPSVSGDATSQDIGDLKMEKKLEGTGNTDYSKEEYSFRVELLKEENGTPLNQTFSYSRSDGTYGTIRSGGTVALRQNESILISGIPAGTYYRVTELSHEGYHTTANGTEGYIAAGTIETGLVKPASFVNTPAQELPETGAAGTWFYTLGGIILIAGALLYGMIRWRRGAA